MSSWPGLPAREAHRSGQVGAQLLQRSVMVSTAPRPACRPAALRATHCTKGSGCLLEGSGLMGQLDPRGTQGPLDSAMTGQFEPS